MGKLPAYGNFVARLGDQRRRRGAYDERHPPLVASAPSPGCSGFRTRDMHAVVDEPLALVGRIRVGLAADMTRSRVGEPERGLDAISAPPAWLCSATAISPTRGRIAATVRAFAGARAGGGPITGAPRQRRILNSAAGLRSLEQSEVLWKGRSHSRGGMWTSCVSCAAASGPRRYLSFTASRRMPGMSSNRSVCRASFG